MAKTLFVNGSDLYHTFMNTIFGQGAAGGHKHDGADADGSCPRIALDAGEIQGVLPYGYVGHRTGTFGVKITTTYLTVEQTGTAKYQVEGNIAVIKFPGMNGTSNSTALKLSMVTTFPTELIPAMAQQVPILVANNTKLMLGMITIPTGGGDMEFGTMVDGNDNAVNTTLFTASGTKGIVETTITYLLA
jgi:hypothetical protein